MDQGSDSSESEKGGIDLLNSDPADRDDFEGLTDDRSGLVTAKGTADGLVLRLDGRAPVSSLQLALADFINPRKGFLIGNDVSLEWVANEPNEDVLDQIKTILQDEYKIGVKESALAKPIRIPKDAFEEQHPKSGSLSSRVEKLSVVAREEEGTSRPRSLFDGLDSQDSADFEKRESSVGSSNRANLDGSGWDDPDARLIYGTLRSGQKVESEHSLVVVGDVNPGAEIVAGGDIIVLGALRGIAHAGAYEESGGGRMIFALNLQPTQLRIGTTISRGSAENRKVPEVARVEGNIIVVEPFQARSSWFQR